MVLVCVCEVLKKYRRILSLKLKYAVISPLVLAYATNIKHMF